MSIQQKIKMVCAYLDISESELARRMGVSKQNFHQKLKRGKFSNDDLLEIGKALGGKFDINFILEDGTII